MADQAPYWRDDALERRRPMMEPLGPVLRPDKGRQGHPVHGRLDPQNRSLVRSHRRDPSGVSGVFFLVIVLEETKLPADL
jgi:hypothetical protein